MALRQKAATESQKRYRNSSETSHPPILITGTTAAVTVTVTVTVTDDREKEIAMERRLRNDLHKLDVYRCALQLYQKVRNIAAMLTKMNRSAAPAVTQPNPCPVSRDRRP